jgi:hypothetical protein
MDAMSRSERSVGGAPSEYRPICSSVKVAEGKNKNVRLRRTFPAFFADMTYVELRW